jgi:hypothetical protein
MVKRLAIDRYGQILHPGKIRFTPLARLVDLREIHFLTGAMQSSPHSDPPLKRPQLPILVFAGSFTLEGFEQCFGFETWVSLEKILDPMPIVFIEWVLPGFPGMKGFALTGELT